MSTAIIESRAATLTVGTGSEAREIAARILAPSRPDTPFLVWLGGYRSDMSGTKAIELERFAHERGLGCLRFDYSGHGISGANSEMVRSRDGWKRARLRWR